GGPDRAWARYQPLWLAERAAHLAALGALADHRGAAARAGEILRAYAARYFRYPNRDNVLGPSRLFFSTYLESLWIGNILAAAVLLRESGNLDEATTRAVNQVAEEAANLIGEFDEGFSNRQTSAGGAARARPQRAPGFHVSGAQGLAVRRVARPPDVSRAVGGGARESRGAGSGERYARARELADDALSDGCDQARSVRVLLARRTHGP